jgi:CBS domain-containing protein
MTIAAILKSKGNDVVSVPPTASALEIAGIITSRRIGAVLVLDDAGRLAGIVSERDVVKCLARHQDAVATLTAADLMTKDVTTATPETTADDALAIMDQGYFRHLPVVTDGKLAGIISIRDVVKYQLDLHAQDVDHLKAYIARQA